MRVARENGKEMAIATCPFRANTSLSNLTVYQNYCVAVAAFSRRGIGPVSLRKCAVVDDGGIPTFFFNLCIFEFLCISFIFSMEILQQLFTFLLRLLQISHGQISLPFKN